MAAVEQVRALLQRKVAYDQQPTLNQEAITELLDLSRRADVNGRLYTDASGVGGASQWIPTFDINFAAAEGWRWKAAQAASYYNFSADSSQFSRAQIMLHCQRMVDYYEAKAGQQVVAQRALGSLAANRGSVLGQIIWLDELGN